MEVNYELNSPIDISNLSNGIYFLKSKTGNTTLKIIKE